MKTVIPLLSLFHLSRFYSGINIWTTLWILVLQSTALGFYVPRHRQNYLEGESLRVKMKSVGFCTLPLCSPLEGIRTSKSKIDAKWENSPYRFRMNVNQSEVFVCETASLSAEDVSLLSNCVDRDYRVKFLLVDLPAVPYNYAEGHLQRTGLPVGVRLRDGLYIFNHVKFKVTVIENEDMRTRDATELIPMGSSAGKKLGLLVVGFEVIPCSLQIDLNSVKNLTLQDKNPSKIQCKANMVSKRIKENERIVFTYEVEFIRADIMCPPAWVDYFKEEGSKVHWFQMLISCMTIVILAGLILLIFSCTVRRDLMRYNKVDNEAQSKINEELSGWNILVRDVFRAPTHLMLICIMVGDGVQILATAAATVLLVALGFSGETLLTRMVFFFLLLSIVGGYVAIRLWKTLRVGDPSGWISVSWGVVCFFPGIAFSILVTLNFLLRGSGSPGAIPISLFTVFLLWVCISVPLTLVGGYFGAKASHLECPAPTNQTPREVPPQKCPSSLLILMVGIFPFVTIFIELLFIMSSISMGRVYHIFGFLTVVLILLLVVCAEVSIVFTYGCLRIQDWRWWWKSFFSSGSAALYIFLYSIKHLVFDMGKLSRPVSPILYLGYSLLMATAIMLATGTVGFLSSIWFVHYLFTSLKLE